MKYDISISKEKIPVFGEAYTLLDILFKVYFPLSVPFLHEFRTFMKMH